MRPEVIRARIDIILNRIRALAVRIVVARHLHKAGHGDAGAGVAGGYLLAIKERMTGSASYLELASWKYWVVLGAGEADIGVELGEGDVEYIEEGEAV